MVLQFALFAVISCIMISVLASLSNRATIRTKGRYLGLSMSLSNTLKRKVTLVGGYVGTNYYGLQMDPNRLQPENFLPTIENEYRLALIKAGCVLETNGHDLARLSWSRSSRTDKGVHAARIVFSAKLELDPKTLPENPEETVKCIRFPDVVKRVNQHLPENIRLFSCSKINNAFNARENGIWRGYDYVLPLNILQSGHSNGNVEDTDAVIQKLNSILGEFVGPHSFHNFHRMSPREMKKGRGDFKDKRRDEKAPAGIAEEYEESLERTAQIEDELLLSSPSDDSTLTVAEDEHDDSQSSQDTAAQKFTMPYGESWVPAERSMSKRVLGTIYACQAELIPSAVSSSGKRWVRVKIVGQAFLLHQIRIMISSAIMIHRGILPSYFLQMAFAAPIHFPLPLAPAEGLVLVNAGFHRSARNHDGSTDLAMSTESLNVFIDERKNVHGLTEEDYTLMSNKEYKASIQFFEQKIYPQVIRDWEQNDASNKKENLLEEYQEALQRFQIASSTLQKWQSIHNTHVLATEETEQLKSGYELNRVTTQLGLFYERIKPLEQKKDLEMWEVQRVRTQFSYRKFLPNSVASAVTVRYQLFPGDALVDVLRILASHVIRTKKPFTSTDDVLAYLDSEVAKNNAKKKSGGKEVKKLLSWCSDHKREINVFIE